jgi:hypothetical protein
VPVIVSVCVPLGVAGDERIVPSRSPEPIAVVTVRVDVDPLAVGVTLFWENCVVVAAGAPDTESVTGDENPPVDVAVMV